MYSGYSKKHRQGRMSDEDRSTLDNTQVKGCPGYWLPPATGERPMADALQGPNEGTVLPIP